MQYRNKQQRLRELIRTQYPKLEKPEFLPTHDARGWLYLGVLELMGIEAHLVTNEGERLGYDAALKPKGSRPLNLLTVTGIEIKGLTSRRGYGEIATERIFDPATREPVSGGLYCPKIFGQTADMSRFGRISLAVPMPHPLFPDEPDFTMRTVLVAPIGYRYADPSGRPTDFLNLLYQEVVCKSNQLRTAITCCGHPICAERATEQLSRALHRLFYFRGRWGRRGIYSLARYYAKWFDRIKR